MADWWNAFGRWSLISGVVTGLLLALLMTWQRTRAKKKGKPFLERLGWIFALDWLNASTFFALLFALNEMVRRGLMPSGLRWYLIVLAALSVTAATGVGHFARNRVEAEEAEEKAEAAKPAATAAPATGKDRPA